jgi:hypothetical protein
MQTDFEPFVPLPSTASQAEECSLQLRLVDLEHCAVIISDLRHERQS